MNNPHDNRRKFNIVLFCLVIDIAISAIFYTSIIYFMLKPFMKYQIMEHQIVFLWHKNIYINKNVHLNIFCDHKFLWVKNIIQD